MINGVAEKSRFGELVLATESYLMGVSVGFLIRPTLATIWIYLSFCDTFINFGNCDNDRKQERRKKKYLLFYHIVNRKSSGT